MPTRFEITAYAQVQTALESLRIAAGALVDQAATLADCHECESDGLDEFGQPNNAVLKILSKLRRDINDRIHRAREAIQTDLHSTHGQGRMPCWATQYGD
jgi:hypothetical protein